MKVENMASNRGTIVSNQFIITDDFRNEYFQSYSSVIVKKCRDGSIFLDENKWDYSPTTGRYRNQFLGESKKETKRKLKEGIYHFDDLNAKQKLEHIGVVAVDSGTLLIADPSYALGNGPQEVYAQGLDAFWDTVSDTEGDGNTAQLYFDKGHAGAGVTFQPGYGDGLYDVFVKRNSEGRITQTVIYSE